MSEFPEYKHALVSERIPSARNSRTHSDEQVSKIAASIREFGFLWIKVWVFGIISETEVMPCTSRFQGSRTTR